MGTFTRWFGAATAGLVVTGSFGCVGVKEHNKALEQRDVAIIQRDLARTQVTGLVAEVESYKEQLGAVADKDLTVQDLTNETLSLRGELAEINTRYGRVMDTSAVASMPGSLKNDLAAFASKNSDLVEFDAAKGVVRFKSDATFAKGSAELTAKGKQVAADLATILSSGEAATFELMVAGHTDGTPVSNPATIKAGHKDNWHLSAHRAIAFGKVFQANNVHPRRMAMVGYADQRPVTTNASESGRSQNRRVEVLVLNSKVNPTETTPSTLTKAATNTPAPATNDDNWFSSEKDDASADASGWNK
jgi:chemotaxis protein MotB